MNFLPGWHPAPSSADVKDIEYRFVGSYEASFSSSDSATFNIDGADLQLGPTDRQLVFFVEDREGNTITDLTIGAGDPLLYLESAAGMKVFAGYYETASGVTITVGTTSSNSGVHGIQVWEVINAHPGTASLPDYTTDSFGSSSFDIDSRGSRIADGGLVLWSAWRDNTNAHSWSGDATEQEELVIDSSSRMSTAYYEANSGNEDPAVTVSISGSFGQRSEGLGFFMFKKDAACVGHQRFVAPIETTVSGASSGTVDGDMSTLPGNHDISTGVTVLVFVQLEENTTISDVTYGGVSMTRIAQANNTSASPDLIHELWQLDNVTALGDITVTFGGSITADLFCNTAYVKGTVGTPVTATGNSTGTTSNVAVQDKGAVLCAHMRSDSGQSVTPTGVSEFYDTGSANSEYRNAYGGLNGLDADASYSVGFAAGSSSQWSQIAVPIGPPA